MSTNLPTPSRTRHLRPDCDDAAMAAGSLGPSALERALVTSLGLAGRWSDGDNALRGLRGWGALYADAERVGSPPPPAIRSRGRTSTVATSKTSVPDWPGTSG